LDKYVAPVVGRALPASVHALMSVVGFIEIGAGLPVPFRPRISAHVPKRRGPAEPPEEQRHGAADFLIAGASWRYQVARRARTRRTHP
jgi:hypothetical protein